MEVKYIFSRLVNSFYFLYIAVVSSSDDKKVSAVGTPALSVSTVGEVTSSDTTVVPGQPSPSQDKVCVFILSGAMVNALSCSFTPSQYNPAFYLLSLP